MSLSAKRKNINKNRLISDYCTQLMSKIKDDFGSVLEHVGPLIYFMVTALFFTWPKLWFILRIHMDLITLWHSMRFMIPDIFFLGFSLAFISFFFFSFIFNSFIIARMCTDRLGCSPKFRGKRWFYAVT